jgi:anti-sigma B factor antagonist
MRITEKRQGAVAVIQADGPLVGEDAEQLGVLVSASAANNLGRVVIDLSSIPFVDSRGLEILLDLAEKVSEGGRTLKLCAANKTVRQVLELTGLVSHFEYFDDTHSAVRSFL